MMGLTELRRALGVLRRSSALWWQNWLVLAALNLVWAVCVATLLLGPPATFGLYRAARLALRGEEVSVLSLLYALRGDLLRSWLWLLVTLGAGLGVVLTLRFYGELGTGWAAGLQFVTLLAGAVWAALQLYVVPYLLEQGSPSLRRAYQNALLTSLASPIYTLTLAGAAGLLLYLGTRLAFLYFLGLPCLVAVLGVCAVQERLETLNVRRRG